MELNTWGYQVPPKLLELESPHHGGGSSPNPPRVQLHWFNCTERELERRRGGNGTTIKTIYRSRPSVPERHRRRHQHAVDHQRTVDHSLFFRFCGRMSLVFADLLKLFFFISFAFGFVACSFKSLLYSSSFISFCAVAASSDLLTIHSFFLGSDEEGG